MRAWRSPPGLISNTHGRSPATTAASTVTTSQRKSIELIKFPGRRPPHMGRPFQAKECTTDAPLPGDAAGLGGIEGAASVDGGGDVAVAEAGNGNAVADGGGGVKAAAFGKGLAVGAVGECGVKDAAGGLGDAAVADGDRNVPHVREPLIH